MMWWAILCAAVVACSACADAAPASNGLASAVDWEQLDSSSPDDESLGYAAPSMQGGRNYGGNAPWMYLLAEVPRDSQVSDSKKMIRSRRTFSVNPAVEVLQREALNQFLERQAHANRNFLNCVGKRDPWSSQECAFTS